MNFGQLPNFGRLSHVVSDPIVFETTAKECPKSAFRDAVSKIDASTDVWPPNITGSSNGAVTYGEATSGAIYTPPMTSYRIASDSVSNMSTAGAMTFDASRSSSIYSTKMQPKSLQVLPCIRC